MSRVRWRWNEKDFGFRFREGTGKRTAEHYQAGAPGEFYIVSPAKRKLPKEQAADLAKAAEAPTSPRIVPNPWKDYERDWDWIVGPNGILLNYAGCLDQDELHRREDEGVARAMEFILALLDRPEPVALTVPLVQQVHRELLGEIYPFAGEWRLVTLHKGDGPTKWPLPPGGIAPLMDLFERDVLTKSPVISEDNPAVMQFAAEVMLELVAIHPFREGNGRTAFILANLILLQNDLLPLDVYDRHHDEEHYFEACEAGRLKKDYQPMAALIREWEDAALERWEASHGNQ